MKGDFSFGCIALATALSVADPALAQEAAPASSDAQETRDNSGGLAEIVVTARRRTENLQEVPVAVTSLDERALEGASITSLRDISQKAPSLRFIESNQSPSSSYVSIRGQGVGEIRINADPAVGMYIDGINYPRFLGTELNDLLDVASVEVLKGPQGTLFGKNTTGGAINVTTIAPSRELEGLVRGRVSSFKGLDLAGVLNIPVSDTLAVRLVASSRHRGGTGINVQNGQELGKISAQSYRGTVQWQPSDRFTLTARADYSKAEGTYQAWRPVDLRLNSPAFNVVRAATGLTGEAVRQAYLNSAPADYYSANMDRHPDENVKGKGWSLTMEYELSDSITVKSITGQRKVLRANNSDTDGSPFRILQSFTRTTSSQLSQELQLIGDTANFDWIVGGYVARERGTERTESISLGAAVPSLTIGELENRTKAIFGQATLMITDKLSATAGLRYTKDNRELLSRNRTATTCTALGIPLASITDCAYPSEVGFDAFSYTGSLEYRPTDDVFVYAKTSRGYRAGGLALSGGSAIGPAEARATFTPFQPEEVTDYELGLKSEWFDRKLRVNFDLFQSDYSNIQRSVATLVPGTTNAVVVIVNVAEARIRGAELEVQARPVDRLELSAATAYTKAKFTDYSVGGVDLTSTPFLFTPKWAYNLSTAYTAPLGFGDLRGQLDYAWRGPIVTSGTGGVLPRLGLVNARLSLTVDEYDLDVSAFVKNLANKKYAVYRTDTTAVIGYSNIIVGSPRVWGLEVTKRF